MEINLYENQSLKLIYTKYLQPDQYTFNRINIPSTGSIYLQPDQYTFIRIRIDDEPEVADWLLSVLCVCVLEVLPGLLDEVVRLRLGGLRLVDDRGLGGGRDLVPAPPRGRPLALLDN